MGQLQEVLARWPSQVLQPGEASAPPLSQAMRAHSGTPNCEADSEESGIEP